MAGFKCEMELEKSSSLKPPLTNGSLVGYDYIQEARMLRHSKKTATSQEAIMVDLL